jgi:competence protein ComEA
MQRAFVLTVVCAGFLAMALHERALAAPGVPAFQSSESEERDTVELNTATATQLRTLPGVGERTAQRIIEYREEHGGFERIEDLMNVRGIGERTFLRLKPLIRVDAPAGRGEAAP